MRLPSIRTIQTLGVDLPTAREIRRCFELYREGELSDGAACLSMVDPLMGGYGVEYIASTEDTLHSAAGLDYVNMGDTYAQTVIFDNASDTFLLGSWGDLIECRGNRYL